MVIHDLFRSEPMVIIPGQRLKYRGSQAASGSMAAGLQIDHTPADEEEQLATLLYVAASLSSSAAD